MRRPSLVQSWSVYMLRKRATLVGFVHAVNEDDAIKRAIAEFQIRRADQFRLCARPGY
jgi:hypothetical protein